MAVNCPVCEHKNQEISFLREMIKELIEQKKIETGTFTPVYINDTGETIKGDEAQVVDE